MDECLGDIEGKNEFLKLLPTQPNKSLNIILI